MSYSRLPSHLPSHGLSSLEMPRHIMVRPHRHNDVELNFVERGALTYLLGGQTVLFEAGNLYVFWAAMPHQIVHAAPESAHRVLTIPLPDILNLGLPDPFMRTLLNGSPLWDPDPENGVANRVQFRRWHRLLARRTDDCARIVLLEVEACLRRLALPATRAAASASSRSGAPGFVHVQAMIAFISIHYTEPISVDAIAGVTGLHPNYAMQLFRKHAHMTLLDYLTQYRIAHAQRLLLTSDASVLDVALACGFNSQSRFYAAFKQMCGQSPGAYRRAHRHDRLPEQQIVSLLTTLQDGTQQESD